MGAYSELDMELRCGGEPQEGDNAFVDDGEDCCEAVSADDGGSETEVTLPPTPPAPMQAATPQPETKPADQASTKSAADKAAEEDAKRKAHEEAEAKRKAEWEEKHAKKRAEEQKKLDEVAAMGDDEVLAASTRRVSTDIEKLTRRNLKECVAEYIQTLCLDDAAFARKVMHPRKSMIHCIWYINRKAREFIEQEMKDNDFPKENGVYGSDVPDDVCYQWAVDYFNDPEAKEDFEKDEKFVPQPYRGTTTASSKKSGKGKSIGKSDSKAGDAKGKAAKEPTPKEKNTGQLWGSNEPFGGGMMKKLNKKACRQFLEPLTAPKSDCGLFLIEKLDYIIRTTIKIIGHRRVLVLCLYGRGDDSDNRPNLVYTVFQASDSFITYDHDPSRRTPWRTAMLDNLECKYLFAEKYCAFYSRADEQRVLDFCKDRSGSGARVLGIYQERIRDRATRIRIRHRQGKIVKEFQELRPLPKGVESWLRRDVLPAYFFYDYRKGAKRTLGVCSACGQEVELEGVRHNAEGICPHCGRKFTMKSNKKCGRIWDRETASVVQRLRENELVVRILKVSLWRSRGGNAEMSFYEETRVIIRQTCGGKPQSFPYHYDPYKAVLTPWKRGYPPICYMYGENYAAETCGHLYCRNLDRELKGTPWQYCQLAGFYRGIQDQIEVAPYLTTYREVPAIEYFVKLGLYWLAAQIVYRGNNSGGEQIINLNGKNLRQILQIDPADLCWLQRTGAGPRDLFLLRLLCKEGHTPDGNLFAWMEAHHIESLESFKLALSLYDAAQADAVSWRAV